MVIPGGGVTGSGDLIGDSADEALRLIAGELGTAPDLAFLPVLADRGPGADAVGRTAALVTRVTDHFSLATTPSGWRIDSGRGSREMRRARSWLGEDLDAAEQHLAGYERDLILPVIGPWSLAASIELVTGHRLVRDPGAVNDLVQALAQACADLVAEVARRIPGCSPVVRLDEPHLATVLAGGVSTPSGLDRYRAVDATRAVQALQQVLARVLDIGGQGAVRVARGELPLAVMTGSGAVAVSTDLASIDLARHGEMLGEFIDSGNSLLVGVAASDPAATVDSVTRLWTRLGFALEALPASIAIQPSADASPARDAVAQFAVLRAASARLRDVSEESGVSERG